MKRATHFSPVIRTGFTLIELIVVLVIIGIVGVAVAPSLLQSPAVATGGVAAPVVDLLKSAQRAAVDSGRAVRVVVDPSNGAYVARMAGRNDPLSSGTIALTGGVSLQTDSVRAEFSFAPSGDSRGDPLAVHGQGQEVWVAVDQWTGAINVIGR